MVTQPGLEFASLLHQLLLVLLLATLQHLLQLCLFVLQLLYGLPRHILCLVQATLRLRKYLNVSCVHAPVLLRACMRAVCVHRRA